MSEDDIQGIVSRNPLTFEEAERYFKEKIPITPKEFEAIAEQYRALAFTVSGYTKAQVLKKFYDALLSAIENGTTMKSFRDEMNSFLETCGYTGITAFQADNIFRTNVQTAYQVGHYEQMTQPEVLQARPYWMYDAVNDTRTRPSHLAMDGHVFPADSPVWDTWYPPNGFRCRCTVRSLSQRQVEDRGLEVESEVPRSAELPNGRFTNIYPDPHFATNPAKTRFQPDFKGYPETLVKAYKRREEQNTGSPF